MVENSWDSMNCMKPWIIEACKYWVRLIKLKPYSEVLSEIIQYYLLGLEIKKIKKKTTKKQKNGIILFSLCW